MSATRREFLKSGALAGGAFVIGFRLPSVAQAEGAVFRPNGWVRIDATGKVFLTVGKSEMGQGVRTSLPMMLAEELGVDLDTVELVQASPSEEFPDLETSGSRSIRDGWVPLRKAGAAAREMLVAAAAARWGVVAGTCRAQRGRVLHPASGKSVSYGALVDGASRLPVPQDPQLTKRSEFRLIGRGRRRIDAPRIVRAVPLYACDVRRPGMKTAVVLRCPVYGGSARSWNAEAAKGVPGVRLVVPISAGLAVIADDTWAALRGRDALEPTILWDEGENAAIGSDDLVARLREAVAREGRALRRGEEDSSRMASACRTLSGEYFYPFQAHAPVEPMNAVADVRPDRCEIWAGTQNPDAARAKAARLLGIPSSAVTVHVTLLGGGFGRRGRFDFVLDAVEASRAAGAPVQVLWTRQDDMRHGYHHPASLHRLTAGLDADGRPIAWSHRVVGVSAAGGSARPVDDWQLRANLRGAYDLPYGIPAISAQFVEVPSPIRIGAWRGVQCNHNVFAAECFLDELALAAGSDPYRYRLALLEPGGVIAGGRDALPVERFRLAKVLSLAAEKSGWDRPLPAGRGRGIACAVYNGHTYVAAVAQVAHDFERGFRVERVVCALDCGVVVNPLGLSAQVEGAVIWALSSLSSQITLRNGRVEQGSYGDFPVMRMADAPSIETHAVDSDAPPTGVGEPPTPVAIAATANGIFAATGQRVRAVPIRLPNKKEA